MFLDKLRGKRSDTTDLKMSYFWKPLLYDVYLQRLKHDMKERVSIKSIIHDKSSNHSVLAFICDHTNSFLITESETNGVTNEAYDRIYNYDQFILDFTKNKYCNPNSPSERKDSGRFSTDMFIFYKVDLPPQPILDRCGINKLIHIQ